jgi:hypothetical protein
MFIRLFIPSYSRIAQPFKTSSQPIFRTSSPVFRTNRNLTHTQNRSFVSTIRAMASFDRLIRFESQDGKTVYGNLENEVPTREIEGSSVEVLEGDLKSGFRKTGRKVEVGKVRSHFDLIALGM